MRTITDEEILERTGGDLLKLDELDRHPETQKQEGTLARDRAAVEAALALDHEQR